MRNVRDSKVQITRAILEALAGEVARLEPSRRDPERFHIEKDRLAAKLRQLAEHGQLAPVDPPALTPRRQSRVLAVVPSGDRRGGGRKRLLQTRVQATAERTRQANKRAAEVAIVVDEICRSGVLTLSGIARELNRRELRGYQGGRWSATAVSRLLRRLEKNDGALMSVLPETLKNPRQRAVDETLAGAADTTAAAQREMLEARHQARTALIAMVNRIAAADPQLAPSEIARVLMNRQVLTLRGSRHWTGQQVRKLLDGVWGLAAGGSAP
jgi:hypothetical protein